MEIGYSNKIEDKKPKDKVLESELDENIGNDGIEHEVLDEGKNPNDSVTVPRE